MMTVDACLDDRQGIYSFRGANIENILKFLEHFPDAKVYNLERNYRSQANIVDAAEQVILKNKEQLPKNARAMNPAGDKIRAYAAFDDDEEAAFIADRIEQMVNQYGYDYKDIAVLYRMNFISRQVETALMSHKIPYVIIGGTHFYGRREIRDAMALLRVAINPNDDAAVLRLMHLLPGVGEKSIDSWMQHSAEEKIGLIESLQNLRVRNSKAMGAVELLLKMVEELQFAVMALPLDQYLEYAINRFGYLDILEQNTDNMEDVIARKQNVAELIRAAAQIQETEDGIMAAVRLLDMALQSEGDQKHEGVRLMTVHASKGLEFKVVFVVAFNDGIIPARTGNAGEERRLAYVALTRAKERLYLTFANQRFNRGSSNASDPSPFLADIPNEFLKYEY